MLALRRKMPACTDDDERREGELLGYTAEQNELWLRLGRSKGRPAARA